MTPLLMRTSYLEAPYTTNGGRNCEMWKNMNGKTLFAS